jgi:hypothetical protein
MEGTAEAAEGTGGGWQRASALSVPDNRLSGSDDALPSMLAVSRESPTGCDRARLPHPTRSPSDAMGARRR